MKKPATLVFGALLVLLFGLYFSFTGIDNDTAVGDGKYFPILARGDGHYIYMNTLSLVFDRDLKLENQYRTFGDPFNNARSHPHDAEHVWIYPVGTAILQAPFFLVGHAAVLVADAFGAGIPTHGYTRVHQRFTFVGAVLAAFGTLVFGYRLARRRVSEAAALYATVVIGLGTALLFYGVYWTSYNHVWTAFAVAWLLDAWDATRGRFDARRWAVLGALVGLCVLTRLQEVLFAAVPAAEWALELGRRARARDGRGCARLVLLALVAGAAALAVAWPQLVANRIVFGGFFVTGQPSPYYMRWESPFFWETLFSSNGGLFVWTPLCYLGVIGLFVALVGTMRGLAATLLLGFVLQVYVNGAAWSWWSDWTFSSRRYVDSTAIFIAGTAFLAEAVRRFCARRPSLPGHLAAVLAFLPLVALNLELAQAVARQRQPVGRPVDSGKLYTDSFVRVYRGVASALGPPASWPASWIWGLRHWVSPGRYEDVVGHERLAISLYDYRKPGVRDTDILKLGDEGVLKVLGVEGWRAPQKDGARSFSWAQPGARLLVPLHVADNVRLLLRASPPAADSPVTVEVNGDWHTDIVLAAGFGEAEVAPPSGVLHPGTNELVFRCAPPAAPGTGCLAVTELVLVYQP